MHKTMHKLARILTAVFAFAMCAALTVEARSITGVSRHFSPGQMLLGVTFEAGEPGDKHALYIAYDTEDKGADISNWAALQRGCVVADDATSATIPVSPLLTGAGYTLCRVFLTTSAAPYDTLIEYLRQTGTQHIDTGIKPNGNSAVAVIDAKLDSNATRQQRFFGVSSSADDTAKFSFDCYINGSGYFASACKNGQGDWKSTGKFTTDRVRISLSAADKHRVAITNVVTGAQIINTKYSTSCSNTSVANLLVFAQNGVKNSTASPANIAAGANLYSFTLTQGGSCVCDYKPCKLGNRAGVYDAVAGNIRYSASGTDFDAANSGSPIACSLLAGETQIAAAPAATGLFSDYTWRGAAANWGGADASWTKDGDPTPVTWADGNNAIFATANATATLTADAAANSVVFNADATIATNGTDAATLAVKSVSVDSGVSATISAPTAGALEKTGAGTLTLTENRADATIVTAGTLKMDGATVADLTLGTDGGAPVTFDYGGQELVKNAHGLDYLVTGSTVMLTNGIFSTASDYDLNIRDDTFTMPSVLTIAKDAVVRQGAPGKSIYINNISVEARTINVVGGTLGNTEGCNQTYLQHKSSAGGLNINVTDGGLVYFPCTVYALCGNNTVRTTPSLYMTFDNSAFIAGTFNFGNIYNSHDYAPTSPTAVFAATNSVVSVANDFIVGRDKQDSKTDGSYRVDFEGSIVTAKTFTVYYDRPLNNARFNNTRFVFNAESGSIAANDSAANWFTVDADGLILDTQAYSATLNANLGGSGAVTKTGTGTLTVSRGQTTTGGFNVSEGTLALNAGLIFNRPIAVASGATLSVNAANTTSVSGLSLAADSTLNITSYNCTAPLAVSSLSLPESGTVNLTLNGGAFTRGVYVIYSKNGVTAADGAKFTPSTGNLDFSWSVSGDKLVLTVGELPGNYWTGLGGDGRMSTAANWLNGVPAAGADIDLSAISSATTIIADTGRAFGTVTMGNVIVTFASNLTVTAFSNMLKLAVAADSTVTIDNDITLGTEGQKLCKTIAAGGTLRITGSVKVSHSSGEVKAADIATAEAGAPGAIVVEGGIVVKTDKAVIWNAKTLALGASGISFTQDAPFYFTVNGAAVYSLGATTVLGTGGIGKFRSRHDDVSLCTTQYGSDQPAVITFDGNFNGASSGSNSYWGHWRATGGGRVVCTAASSGNRGLRVYAGATFALTPSSKTMGANDQHFDVHANGTLEVAASGTRTVTGDLNLDNGAVLGFNFTGRTSAPVLALSSGKSVVFTEGESTNITVKVSGTVRPKGGEHQLTTCGGFGAEGVSVSLAAGTPKWVKGVSVNGDGNIVITVNPKGLMIIFK